MVFTMSLINTPPTTNRTMEKTTISRCIFSSTWWFSIAMSVFGAVWGRFFWGDYLEIRLIQQVLDNHGEYFKSPKPEVWLNRYPKWHPHMWSRRIVFFWQTPSLFGHLLLAFRGPNSFVFLMLGAKTGCFGNVWLKSRAEKSVGNVEKIRSKRWPFLGTLSLALFP